MFWLDVEVPQTSGTLPVDDSSLAVLESYRQRWSVRVWEPYRAKRGALRAVVFESAVVTHDSAEEFSRERFSLETGDKLFDQLLDLYMVCGLRGIYGLTRHVNSAAGGLTYHTRGFINDSVGLLEEMVAGRLLELQGEASESARQQIIEQRLAIKNMRNCFEKRHAHFYELYVGRLQRTGAPPPVGAKDRLYELFKTCFRLKRSIAKLQEGVDERNRKDGGDAAKVSKARERDEYRRLLADQFLKPQAKLIAEFMAARGEIENIFPAAVFVLEELEEDVLKFLSIPAQAKAGDLLYRASRDVQLKYDSKIYYFLGELAAELDTVFDSLAREGVEDKIADYLSTDVRQRITELGGLHECIFGFCLSKQPGLGSIIESGITRGVLGVYFKITERRQWSQFNRVLGSLGVVFRLEEDYRDQMPGLRNAVLTQYRVDLERKLAELEAEENRSRQRWHFVEVIVAVAGLLLAAISIPFGAGAVGVPAGLALTLSVLHTALLLTGLVLMVKSIGELITANMQARAELQARLIEVGQTDAKALRDFAGVAARNHALFDSATTGLALELVKLALAHKLKPVAYALDMQGYFDDVEYLQASLGMDTEEESEDEDEDDEEEEPDEDGDGI
jgi:hypothetical protein